ncbi:hypothetical protein JOC37_002456 [Desulfohalotomaculum tongense]|nr:hypothetical protein [Desulforadius tongensis]
MTGLKAAILKESASKHYFFLNIADLVNFIAAVN